MKIKINKKRYEARIGETILDVCRRNKIRTPALCAHENLPHESVCRLCVVEINLTDKLVTACSFPVCEKLEVTTESERIKKARGINMELLWSDHAGKCISCKKNRRCELQNLAEEYEIENFHFVPRKGEMTKKEELELLRDNWSRVVVDENNPAISRTTEFCVECRRCINVCPTYELGFNHRGGDVVVGTPYEESLDCIFCGQCLRHCPTAAITDNESELSEIVDKLDNLKKLAVAIVDPVIADNINKYLPEIKSGVNFNFLLRKLGFEKVFDLSWGIQEYVVKIANEIKEKNKIVLGTFCPAFTLHIKKNYPDLNQYVSSLAFPDELLAREIKTTYAKNEKINPEDVVIVSISSCTAKKSLNNKYLDYVISAREIAKIVGNKEVESVEKNSSFDDPFKYLAKSLEYQNPNKIIRILKGKARKEPIKTPNEIVEIKKILEDIRKGRIKRGFIEGLVCSGGCINGGGI
jgi:iron only hydrogenase large subunit-like protein